MLLPLSNAGGLLPGTAVYFPGGEGGGRRGGMEEEDGAQELTRFFGENFLREHFWRF